MLTARQAKIQKIRIKKERNKRKAENSLACFTRQAWKIVEPGRIYQHNWHIDCIAEHLEAIKSGQIRNLIINVPPRHMKSSLVCVFFPGWVWGPQDLAYKHWLFGSYSPKLSSRDSVKCRRIITSDWYIDNWKDSFTRGMPEHERNAIAALIREDQNEKMRYENIASGIRIATSIGGTGTGDGGDYIIVDDPSKVKGIESEVQRKGVIDWWDNEMSTRGNDPKTVAKIVIMQRVHDDDLSGHILNKEDHGWHHLCLPFEYERKHPFPTNSPLNFKDPRKKDGELLWKNRYDEKSVKDLKKSLNVYQQTGQLQQRPTPKEGVIFKRPWFNRRWTTLPDRFDHILDSWDLTFGDGENAAFNVGYKLGLKMPDIYVIWEVRKKMDILGQLKSIPNLRRVHKETRESLIENAANGKAAAALLKKKIPGVILVNPVGSKEDRAGAVTWIFETENVLFPEDEHSEWVPFAIEEIVGFGPRAKYKDRVDALVHGVEKMTKLMAGADVSFESITKASDWGNA